VGREVDFDPGGAGDFGGGGFETGVIAGGEDDSGARTGERTGAGEANSSACSRNKSGPVCHSSDYGL
jgi:hypothetical protein